MVQWEWEGIDSCTRLLHNHRWRTMTQKGDMIAKYEVKFFVCYSTNILLALEHVPLVG